MKTIRMVGLLLTGLLLAGFAFAQVVPPISLNAELLQGGQVALTWEEPPDGLFEDFEDGVADAFEFDPDVSWSVSDDYLKVVSGNIWQSAWYEGFAFTDFTLEAELLNVHHTNSRGIMFRCSGPQNTGGSGYSMFIAYNVVNYSIYRHTNGSLTLIHGWTDSGDLNTGMGETNRLKIVGSGSDFDIYINDEYQSSFTDDTYSEGWVGGVASSAVETWYDSFVCLPTADMRAADERISAQPGVACDPQGRPLDEGALAHMPLATPALTGKSASELPRVTDELDEFIEYRIYRDGQLVGTSDTESYTDQLTGLGTYSYTVTALYDEGESSGAGPVSITWDPVFLTLTGAQTMIPPSGGNVLYGVHLESTIPNTFPGVTYWTEVELPNGQMFGPLFTFTFTMMPYMDVEVFNLTQAIPALAPAGVYIHTGHVGMYPVSQVSDSFAFEKIGAVGADGESAITPVPFVPEQWKAEVVR